MSADCQPFLDHLQELKTRVLSCVAVVLLVSVVGYIYYNSIFVTPFASSSGIALLLLAGRRV